jgi:hypothetical protein
MKLRHLIGEKLKIKKRSEGLITVSADFAARNDQLKAPYVGLFPPEHKAS